MNHVTYISAGAGSGKTFTLTSILADLIIKEKAAPEEFILTTFTEAAAAEFKEKAKAKIFEQQKNPHYAEYAERLDQAMIGTVDSVSYAFVQKYWYLLGISPNLRMVDDDQKKFFIGQILASIATAEETAFLKDFCEQFGIGYSWGEDKKGLNYDFWKDDVKEIFEKCKSYSVKDLTLSRDKSLAFAEEITADKTLEYDPQLFKALMEDLENNDDGANKSRVSDIKKYAFLVSKTLRIKDLSGFKRFLEGLPDKLQGLSLLQPVLNSLNNIFLSKRVRDYVIRYIKLIFDYVQKAQTTFEEYKDKNHLIDFTDMETRFVELLDIKEVQDDIRNSYKYVFVDEFQDCSPIQVQIFDKLSEIVGSTECDDLVVTVGEKEDARDFHTHNSIWVGDFKQAIYGFRGADTELTKAVADIIAQKQMSSPKQYMIHSLDTSYRSLQDIVDFTNDVFEKAFEDVLTKEQVVLKSKRGNPDKVQSLKCWKMEGSNTDARIQDLASQIANRIKDGAAPTEFAVLARGNSDLNKLSVCLNALNIPVCRELEIDESRNELTLLSALLNLVINDKDNYSRAVIAFLTQEDFSAGAIIDSKLEYNEQFRKALETAQTSGEQNPKLPAYLEHNELIRKFMERLDFYKVQTIHNLVESLVIGLDLYSVGHCWPNAAGSDETFNALIEASYDYEERCLQAGLPPTISGYIDFCGQNTKSAGSKNGVTLTTFHGSKGLEWKNVILMGLDKEADDDQDLFKYDVFGVQKYHETAPSEADLYPPMIINLMPTIFKGRNVDDEVADKIKKSSRFDSIKATSKSETIRLLYVAITRAKDNLILATDGGNKALHMFKCLGCKVADSYIFEEDKCIDLFDNKYLFLCENQTLEDGEVLQETEYKKYILSTGNKVEETRDLMPSSMPGGVVQAQLIDCSSPITVTGEYDYAELGTCIHNIFCVADNKTEEQIAAMVKTYGFEKNLPDCTQIKKSWESLTSWLSGKFGPANKQYHELPFKHQLKTGQIVTGSIDFVWETSEGCVVVDYKTFSGRKEELTNESSKYYAGKYKGQLECYESALVAAKKKVLAKYLYYPVVGVLVKL